MLKRRGIRRLKHAEAALRYYRKHRHKILRQRKTSAARLKNRIRMRLWRKNNLAHFLSWRKRYYRKNKTKVRRYVRRNWRKYLVRILKYGRAYAPNWRRHNSEKIRKYTRDWKKRHPIKARRANREGARKRRAALRKQNSFFSDQSFRRLCKKFQYHCLCCQQKEPSIKLEPDHVKAISKGGSNSIRNIQPLCRHCNASKHNKYFDYRKTPFAKEITLLELEPTAASLIGL